VEYRSSELLTSVPVAGWGCLLVDGFNATPVELQVCGSMLTQIGDEVRAEMSVLQREMDALMTEGWQGSAANGFAQGWEQWLRGAHDVLDAVHEMGTSLGVAGRSYATRDTTSMDDVTRSGDGL
jgi:WXG100 family type VII secretion target